MTLHMTSLSETLFFITAKHTNRSWGAFTRLESTAVTRPINYSEPFAFESVTDTPHGRRELVQLLGEHQGVRAPAELQVQTPAHLLSACH